MADTAPRGEGDALVERDGPVPLYLQVARQLSGEITSGALAPGSSLGTEPELMSRFGVSRVTLRHAVDLVVAQGLATRRQGKGTYVTPAPLQYPLGELQGTTQVAAAAGHPARSSVTRYHAVRGSADLRDSLELSEEEQVWECWRVDRAADRAIAVAIIHLPDAVGRELSARDLEQTALYPLLEQRLRINTEVAHQTMQAEGAPAEIAELLDVAAGAPVILVVRVARDDHNRPVEHSRTYFRADAMRFSIALYRNRAPDFALPFSFELSRYPLERNAPPRDPVTNCVTTIGLIGSGNIGSTVARLAVAAGFDVVLSNSRGPETLKDLVAELGPHARAATSSEAASAGDIVVVTVPLRAYREVPVEPLAGKVVIDTNNYYPDRDGSFPELDNESTTTAELLQRHLGTARVVKGFNNIYFRHLEALSRPSGAPDRSALAIAGDDEAAKTAVTSFLDAIGYDTVDLGPLAEGWRTQRDTAAYAGLYGSFSEPSGTPADAAVVRAATARSRRYADAGS